MASPVCNLDEGAGANARLAGLVASAWIIRGHSFRGTAVRWALGLEASRVIFVVMVRLH